MQCSAVFIEAEESLSSQALQELLMTMLVVVLMILMMLGAQLHPIAFGGCFPHFRGN